MSTLQKQRLQEPYTYDEAAVAEAKSVVLDWDKKGIVYVPELGGMSPSYEQTIIILIIEFARAIIIQRPQTAGALTGCCQEVLEKINGGLGCSGAQFDVARRWAASAVLLGWNELYQSMPENMRTMAARHFPKAPDPPAWWTSFISGPNLENTDPPTPDLCVQTPIQNVGAE